MEITWSETWLLQIVRYFKEETTWLHLRSRLFTSHCRRLKHRTRNWLVTGRVLCATRNSPIPIADSRARKWDPSGSASPLARIPLAHSRGGGGVHTGYWGKIKAGVGDP